MRHLIRCPKDGAYSYLNIMPGLREKGQCPKSEFLKSRRYFLNDERTEQVSCINQEREIGT